jgi:hypothetical protein
MFTRKHFFSFALLLLALMGWQQLTAQCTTAAGTIQPGSYSVCSNETFNVPYNNDAVLDGNDIVIFVLHDGTATVLGDIIKSSATPSFSDLFTGAGNFQTYQIACIAGNSLGGGSWPDFNDPCLSFSGGATLTINPAPSAGVLAPLLLNCNGNTSVLLNVNVWPLGIAYQYQWSGPVSDPSIKSPTTSTAGTYTVTVTNSICSTTASATVYTPETVPLTIWQGNHICTPPATQQLSASPGAPVSGYSWSTGATTYGITVSAASTDNYCVTVTYDQGCSSSVCDTVVDFVPTATILHQVFGCTDSLNMLYVNSNLGQQLGYQWSTGSTAWSIESPASGAYNVTITSMSGCTAEASFFVENSGDACAALKGNVWGDMNSSCDEDAGDIPLGNVVVSIKDGLGNILRYVYADATGYWETAIEAGTYTISGIPPGNAWNPCPLSTTVTIGAGDTLVQNFYMQPLETCSDLWVDLANSFFRRCLPGSYSLSYCNNGTAIAENAYIEFMLDPHLTIDSAEVAYTPVLGAVNIYRIDLGDVPVGFCGDFWIALHVSCSVNLGQALCSKATIFPHAPCGPQNLWSGASLAIAGTCDQDSVRFTLKNVGTAAMTNALEYVVIEDAIIMKSAPPPSIILSAGEELNISVHANGATWRVQATQEVNHPGNSMPALVIEGCTPGQTFSVGYVNQFPLDDADPWLDEDCSVVIYAWDPNAKEGFPTGYGAQQQIDRNTDIEYIIHFQNTGNDTAFTVVLRDTIAPWLDASTIRPGASSHPYKFDFYGTGSNVKFTFDHINLPDSTTNFQGSQGFISYRISQKPGVPFGTHILNTAAIYFDFNEAVITNTTHHLVDSNYVVTVAAWSPVVQNVSLVVAPNPANDIAMLHINGLPEGTDARVEILDQLGRVCQSGQTTNGNWTVRRNRLAAGMYSVRITTDKGILGTGKLIFE